MRARDDRTQRLSGRGSLAQAQQPRKGVFETAGEC
jgi:hypothetical protein